MKFQKSLGWLHSNRKEERWEEREMGGKKGEKEGKQKGGRSRGREGAQAVEEFKNTLHSISLIPFYPLFSAWI